MALYRRGSDWFKIGSAFWILPSAFQQRIHLADILKEKQVPVLSVGELLLAWWRCQDPLPATRRNERLKEHLERVGYALKHFVDPDEGFDDRARIYVRLGPPWRRVPLSIGGPVASPQGIRSKS